MLPSATASVWPWISPIWGSVGASPKPELACQVKGVSLLLAVLQRAGNALTRVIAKTVVRVGGAHFSSSKTKAGLCVISSLMRVPSSWKS